MATVVEVTDLKKRYGETVAVDGVSLTVQAGEIVGIVGPNGAGKTTTVEMMEGLRRPDTGQVRVLGLEPRRQGAKLRQRIGVQLQQAALPDRLKVWEALDLYASFYRHPADWRRLLEEWGLDAKRNAAFADLSGGQRQRLFIALSLVGRPEVVFLDELTTGLDPQARRATWELVRQVRAKGATVVLVTHFMEEAELLCDRVAIVDRGRVIALDTPSALVRGLGAGQRLRFRPLGPFDPDSLRSLPGVEQVERDGDQVVVAGDGPLLPPSPPPWPTRPSPWATSAPRRPTWRTPSWPSPAGRSATDQEKEDFDARVLEAGQGRAQALHPRASGRLLHPGLPAHPTVAQRQPERGHGPAAARVHGPDPGHRRPHPAAQRAGHLPRARHPAPPRHHPGPPGDRPRRPTGRPPRRQHHRRRAAAGGGRRLLRRRPAAGIPAAVLVYLAGALALYALGFVVAALAPNARAANVIGFVGYFPMIFLCGAVIPREALSSAMRRIGELLPLAPVVTALRDAWSGAGITALTLAALAGMIAVASAVGIRLFR